MYYEGDQSNQLINQSASLRENIRGSFNKFPDFFVHAFKIVVES